MTEQKAASAQPECERTASCEPGDHTYSWPCVHAPMTAEKAQTITVIAEPNPTRTPHPCELGRHRWAWLTDGRQACGYCGRPR